jgi:FkbM family methyltransferase
MVSTIHERLDNVDRQLIDLAKNQTALLQSAVHLIQSLPQIQSEVQQAEMRLAALVREYCGAIQSLPQIQSEVRQAEVRLAALVREYCAAIQSLPQIQSEVQQAEMRLAALVRECCAAIQSLPQIQSEVRQAEMRLAALVREYCAAKPDLEAGAAQIENLRREFNHAFSNLAAADAQMAAANAVAQEAGLAVLRPTLAGVQNLEREYSATRDSIAFLEPVARETRSFLVNEAVRQVCVETSEYASTNPELGLMSFLYSHLPGRCAVDIGAHIGEVSNCLLKTGYEVYAFEPYPPSYTRLSERLKEYPAFHPFNLALGAVEGELPLHLVTDLSNDHRYHDPTVFHSLARHSMPDGLSFHETIEVPVRRLSDLHRSGILPADVSLVKIDTEGYDLEVIRGMDDHRYPVVCVEFWDIRIPFAREGLLYTVESIVREMGRRSYPWYIVLYRVWGENQTAFFCNHDQPVPRSWGNLFFFRDHDTFQQAQQWCAAVLPRTYFKSVPPSEATTR